MKTELLKDCGVLFEKIFNTGKIKNYDTEELYFMIDFCVANDTNGTEVPTSKKDDYAQLRKLLTLAVEQNREDCNFRPQYSKVTIEDLNPQHLYYNLYASTDKKVIVWEPTDDRPEYTGNLPAVYPVEMYLTVKGAEDHYGYLIDDRLHKEVMTALMPKISATGAMKNFN